MQKPVLSLLLFLFALPALAAEPSTSWTCRGEELRPFWLTTTMYGESSLFMRDSPDAQSSVSLLLTPTKVVSVRSSSGETTYVEGTDFMGVRGSRQDSFPPG